MKNCRSIEKKITAYLHGELNDRDIQAMETHLESCAACRAALEAQRTTLALLGATLEAAPAPERLSPWKKPVLRPRSLLEKIWFSPQLKAVLSTAVVFSILFLFSGMFVVFTVVKKEEARFEPPPSLERPKMKLKKLQVPVNTSKGEPKPKLRKSVVAQDDLFGDAEEMIIPEAAGEWSETGQLAYTDTSDYDGYSKPVAGAEFSAPARVARPKMKLKKPKVKARDNATPKPTTRIVTRSRSTRMPDIQLPETEGLGSGLGAVAGYDVAPETASASSFGRGGATKETAPEPADESIKAGKPTVWAASTRPQSTESFYYSYGESVAKPAPEPAAQPAERSGSEWGLRGTAVLAKGKKVELDGRSDGLARYSTDHEMLPELEEVNVFGSALSVEVEPSTALALYAGDYAFMDQKGVRSAGDGTDAQRGYAGTQVESDYAHLFGVAEEDVPQKVALNSLAEDKVLEGAEVDSLGVMLSDSDDTIILGDVMLREQVAAKDEGDRSEWLMRKVGPAVFNPYILAVENAFSTFSIDVDTASYGLARQRLLAGGLPEPEQVRTEEFINSFDYDYRPPAGKQTFAVHSEMAPSPFRLGMEALKIGIKGRRIGRDDHRGAVLTLVVDTSGSMSTPERLGLVKESLALLIDQLNPEDSVAIVQFGNEARLVMDHTPASDKMALLNAINALQPGGPTQFDKGLELGYQLAESGFRAGDSNRIMILSDGVANLGELDPESILKQVAEQRKQGIYLSVLGFGAGTYDDDMLEQLANKGDGMYAYIDTLNEARYLLVDQLAATLHVIASDVKIQVEFNPERVVRYRQLGYENRQLTKEQFRDDTVDAGEVGSGQSVTALYDVELKPEGPADEPIATVYVRYRRADNGAIEEISNRVTDAVRVQRFEEADTRFQLSVCTAEFAERLRRSPYTEGTEIEDIAGRLQPVTLELSLDGQVQELKRLISIAESLEK